MQKNPASQAAFLNLRVLIGLFVVLAGVFLALLGMGAFSSAFAQGKGTKNTNQASPGTQAPDIVQMVGAVRLDQDLRRLPYVPPKPEFEERVLTRYPHPGTGQTGAPTGYGISGLPKVQALLEGLSRPAPTMPGPLLTFEGGAAAQFCACAPPDSDGDVGPSHYIEAINVAFKVFDKNGNTLAGPITYNSLFAPLTGTPCANANDGDPFVFYDQIAHRWVVSDFAFPSFPGTSFYQCIAVSQTSDPVSGGWFLYGLQVDSSNPTFLGDYPKFALWNNPQPGGAYFLTMNLFSSPTTFNGVRAYALDRASMLSGGPTHAIGFTIPIAGLGDSYSLVAATFRTGSAPPPGRDEFLLAIDSPASGGVTLTQVKGWLFHVDFANPGLSTLGVGANHAPSGLMTVSPFVDAFTSAAGFTIVPQQGTTQHLDTLGDRIMTPVVYQNRSGTESLWADDTVCTDANCTGSTAVRWYQFNVTGGTFPATPAQQQSWTNGNDGLWRFMPSIAVDANGSTAIGYSASSTTQVPSIRYAGRLATDPIGNLTQGEAIMFNGTGSQTDTNGRWGDYSMTTIDPADGTTFWHVNEYYATTSSFNWHTRIGKFKFEPKVIVANGTTLVNEGCQPPNGVIDPGETVTVTFKLKNTGGASTTNLVATLKTSGGITPITTSQNYGVIAVGATVGKDFSFVANGACGGTITATFQLQDGAKNLGTVSFTFTLGKQVMVLIKNFDGLTPPALPTGWVATQGANAGGFPFWVTSNSGTPTPVADTLPNAVYSVDPANVLDNRFDTPAFTYTGAAQVTFRQNFDLEQQDASTAFDCGVLEISNPNINGGAFTEIITAGGSFVTGGYNHTAISGNYANPCLPSRPNWSGVSGGFITSTANLPAAGVGQPSKLRWRMCSDNSVSHTGWRVDSVVVTNGYACCQSPAEAISTPTTPSGPASGSTGTNYTYSTSGSTSNLGHPVQYTFNWGDGSASGFLPVGTTSAQHSWTSPGTYLVKSRARCSIHTSIFSSFSNTSVTIAP
jgi:hypothetical protein